MNRLRLLAAVLGALVAGLAVATIAAARSAEDGSPNRNYSFGVGNFGPGCWETHGGPFCTPFDYTMRLLGVGLGESGTSLGRVRAQKYHARHVPHRAGHVYDGRWEPSRDRRLLHDQGEPRPASRSVIRSSSMSRTTGRSERRRLIGSARWRRFQQTTRTGRSCRRIPVGLSSADSIYGYLPLTNGDITVSTTPF